MPQCAAAPGDCDRPESRPSLHLHSRHRRMVHVVVSRPMLVRRPDFLRIRLIRIHVNHPTEHVRKERTARRFTPLTSANRPQESEFGVRSEVTRSLSSGGFAEINMLMPVRHAQRNALVQFILGGIHSIRIHRADELVSAVRGVLVEQRSGLQRIEMIPGGPSTDAELTLAPDPILELSL
jgi:hypothetical protein